MNRLYPSTMLALLLFPLLTLLLVSSCATHSDSPPMVSVAPPAGPAPAVTATQPPALAPDQAFLDKLNALPHPGKPAVTLADLPALDTYVCGAMQAVDGGMMMSGGDQATIQKLFDLYRAAGRCH